MQHIEGLENNKLPGSKEWLTPDRVELSSLTGRLARALDINEAQRAERVRQLAGEYAAGSYRVDEKAVSKAIADEIRTTAHHDSSDA